MKTNILIAFCLLFNICLTSTETWAQKTDQKSAVSLTESNKTYELSATFDGDYTKKIQQYMDESLTDGSSFSFKNTQSDAVITLDNKITFYMKMSPGKLILKFDKRKNSAEFYDRFKKMCEGIRDIIQKGK